MKTLQGPKKGERMNVNGALKKIGHVNNYKRGKVEWSEDTKTKDFMADHDKTTGLIVMLNLLWISVTFRN